MIHSDNALDDKEEPDKLDREPIARAIAETLTAPGLGTPLTVGILGGWGAGKTSLMRLIGRQLDRQAKEDGAAPPLMLWFDAWTYARQEQSLWRALLLKITGELGDRAGALLADKGEQAKLKQQLDELEDSLYRSLTAREEGGFRFNAAAAAPIVIDLALRYATAGLSDLVAGDAAAGKGPMARLVDALKGSDTKEAAKLVERVSRERYVAEVRSLEQFHASFREALRLVGVGAQGGRRLYLFVDDLDRCLPEDAIAAIEAIKLFLDSAGCVFILGMDSDVVHSGIRARYKDYFADGAKPFRPEDYLDKVIQLPFRLPPLDRAQVAKFLGNISTEDDGGLLTDVRHLLEIAVPNNPRTLKRALNVLRLTSELDGCGRRHGYEDGAALAVRRSQLAKIVLMQVCFPTAYRDVLDAGGAVAAIELENRAREGRAFDGDLGPRDAERLMALMREKHHIEDETVAAELLSLSNCARTE